MAMENPYSRSLIFIYKLGYIFVSLQTDFDFARGCIPFRWPRSRSENSARSRNQSDCRIRFILPARALRKKQQCLQGIWCNFIKKIYNITIFRRLNSIVRPWKSITDKLSFVMSYIACEQALYLGATWIYYYYWIFSRLRRSKSSLFTLPPIESLLAG